EEYIIANVRLETLNRWCTKKRSQLQNDSVAGEGKRILEKETKSIYNNSELLFEKISTGNYLHPLYMLCSHLQTSTMSTSFTFYAVGGTCDTIHLYNPELPQWQNDPPPESRTSILPSYPVEEGGTVASHVASTQQSVTIDDITMDERFPKGTSTLESAAVSVMCLPVALPNGDLIGVVEFCRAWHNAEYTFETLAMAQTTLTWATMAIDKTQVSSGLEQQNAMSNFLLQVSRTYLDDITDVDNIIQHIMRFAKTLVSADRCALFLHDKEAGELYSNLFDNGEVMDGKSVFSKKTELRFSVTKGIAGASVRTKQTLNIPDAYSDPRFNRAVDKATGYTTKSILCIPIMSNDEVYGVVEMINRKDGGSFTMNDQNNFQMFAVFCALALRYSKVHTRLQKDQCRHAILKEKYFYHSQYSKADYNELIKAQKDDETFVLPPNFDRFHFSLFHLDKKLMSYFINMVIELAGSGSHLLPSANVMTDFILTVRENYRDIQYHNWQHAMTVTHAMFCMLKQNLEIFDEVERYALLVACVCHDLDHRARSNQFLQKTSHPLALLYPASTMEYHHISMAKDILGRKESKVFQNMTNEEYEKAMYVLKEAILATDLALYFGNRGQIEELLTQGEFDFDNQQHRTSAIGLMMTACDLSSSAKDWSVTRQNLLDLHYEFWEEGDQRKKLGIKPLLPMMDRALEEDLAEGQVGFYSNVSIKCFESLARVLPSCEPLAIRGKENLGHWRKEAEIVKEKKEEKRKIAEKEKQREERLKQEGLGLTLRGGMWVVEESRPTS
uniref:Phosphodiesterase n=1 Tax=Ciona intestinalis TaxID=7719 RepID=F7BQ75_CIOIN